MTFRRAFSGTPANRLSSASFSEAIGSPGRSRNSWCGSTAASLRVSGTASSAPPQGLERQEQRQVLQVQQLAVRSGELRRRAGGRQPGGLATRGQERRRQVE